MEKDKIIESIEEGLLDYYVSLDYSSAAQSATEKKRASTDDQYDKLAKRILFKAKLASRKSLQAKVLSISEASGRLKAFDDKLKGKVFTIFKNHISEYGLAANYRNFDTMTETEMENILRQLNLTALFDEILSKVDNE